MTTKSAAKAQAAVEAWTAMARRILEDPFAELRPGSPWEAAPVSFSTFGGALGGSRPSHMELACLEFLFADRRAPGDEIKTNSRGEGRAGGVARREGATRTRAAGEGGGL